MSDKDTEDVDSTNDDVDETQNLGKDGDSAAANADEEIDGDQVDANEDEATDDPNELKEKLQESNDRNRKLFERAKKAEGFVKGKDGKWVKKEKPKAKSAETDPNKKDDISSDDIYALMEAKVPREDVSEVRDYAKLKGISISEALKSNVVKTILSERSEERRTANAANTGPTRRGSSKPNPDSMLDKASKTGELPESEEDMNQLAEARLNRKSNKE